MKMPLKTAQPSQTVRYATDAARWAAVASRDASADGQFYYSVKTTGVYCRPSCASRLAKRENVHFHDSRADAERVGFRPCKRCHPERAGQEDSRTAAVAGACRAIELSDACPDLDSLAREAGLSRFHFHRLFVKHTGLTPKAYAMARRDERLRSELARRRTVTEAIYEAGFNSNSRFYEQSNRSLGMKPKIFRHGGSGETIRFAIGECSLGSILVAASDKGICAISLGDAPEALIRDLQDTFPRAQLIGGDKTFECTVSQVIGFVEAPRLGLDLPLDIRGTVFQRRVWQALRDIPVGSTISYTELARRIGAPAAVRAVASACAANTLAVAIPCHRVVRLSDDPSGYRWGIARKRSLLEKEAA